MIETARLLIRPWRDSDRAPFAAMNADPEVTRYLGPLQARAQSDAMVDRQIALQRALGHCFWALERHADGAFLGFCGIKPGPDGTPIAGLPEIGWRLARAHWGLDYAREAAEACLRWACAERGWPGVYAITVRANAASWGLMLRLGMQRRLDMDFDHPAVPDGDALKPHLTYQASRPA